MKYYLIVGEASGDLHASHLMAALKVEDPQAEFRFFGGDLMAAIGGTMVKHYKERAGLYGLYPGAFASAHHLCQYETLQRGHRGMATGRSDTGGLSGLQPEYSQIPACQDTNSRLLLYLSEDMGLEGIPHQEYQTGC